MTQAAQPRWLRRRCKVAWADGAPDQDFLPLSFYRAVFIMSIKDTAKRGKRFIVATATWIRQAKLFFLFAIGPIAFCSVLVWRLENWVQLTAAGLQLIGLSVSAYGLDKTRRDFEKPSIPALARDWLAAWPRWRPKPDTFSLSLNLRSRTRGVAPVRKWLPISPTISVEERVAELTRNMEHFASDVYPALKTLLDLGHGNEDGIESESAAREATQKQLDKKLEEAMTDGLLVSFVGLSWTALGILLDVLAPHVLGH